MTVDVAEEVRNRRSGVDATSICQWRAVCRVRSAPYGREGQPAVWRDRLLADAKRLRAG